MSTYCRSGKTQPSGDLSSICGGRLCAYVVASMLGGKAGRTTLVQQTKRKLNKLVYDYFGICGWERYLIEDTEKVFRPSSTPGSLDSDKLLTAKPSKPDDREAYASTLVSTFRGWTRTKAALWARSCIAPKSGLAFVTFGVGGRAKACKESQAEKQVEELLDRIRKSSAHSVGSRCWKLHSRRLSNDLISEMAISESPCREIKQNGEQSVGCCKTKDFRQMGLQSAVAHVYSGSSPRHSWLPCG